MAERLSSNEQRRIRQGKVAIVGLGSVGSHTAVTLARSGVGSFLLIDSSVVESDDIPREYFFTKHIGMLKAEAMAKTVNEVNPFAEVRIFTQKLDENNMADILKGFSIIVEAFPCEKSSVAFTEAVHSFFPQTHVISMCGLGDCASANSIGTKKAGKNLYICGASQKKERTKRSGLLSCAMVCAGHQADVALRLLLGEERFSDESGLPSKPPCAS